MIQATSALPAPAPTESVERPAPGLARGRWEAPPWVFVLVAVATVLTSLAWLVVALRQRAAR